MLEPEQERKFQELHRCNLLQLSPYDAREALKQGRQNSDTTVNNKVNGKAIKSMAKLEYNMMSLCKKKYLANDTKERYDQLIYTFCYTSSRFIKVLSNQNL